MVCFCFIMQDKFLTFCRKRWTEKWLGDYLYSVCTAVDMVSARTFPQRWFSQLIIATSSWSEGLRNDCIKDTLTGVMITTRQRSLVLSAVITERVSWRDWVVWSWRNAALMTCSIWPSDQTPETSQSSECGYILTWSCHESMSLDLVI